MAPGSLADGRLLKEVPIPSGATIVSVRRGVNVIVPEGNTRLAHGDVLTVFGGASALEQFDARLAGTDHVTGEVRTAGTSATFFDVEVPPASVADGRRIAEIAIPEGCTVVSVRRGNETIIPDGSTVLQAGDLVTVFAVPGSRDQLVERLRAGETP